MPIHRRHDVLRCAATLWKRGNRCKNEAAPGAIYCPAHLCLLAPLEWVHGGYARVLDDGNRPIFRAAAYATLSEEVALARLQVSALLRDEKASPFDVLLGVHEVAQLVKLHNKIENVHRFDQGAPRRLYRAAQRARASQSDAAAGSSGRSEPAAGTSGPSRPAGDAP